MATDFPLQLTQAARDQVAALLAEHAQPGQGLRVSIEGGGCAGFRYQFEFDDAEEDDLRQDDGQVRVWVDPVSAQYLEGAQLDFSRTLLASQFVLNNPRSQGQC